MMKGINDINLKIDNINFWNENRHNKGGMRIYWSSDVGRGTLDIIKPRKDDETSINMEKKLVIEAYTEGKDSKNSKEFTSKILNLIVEKLQIVE